MKQQYIQPAISIHDIEVEHIIATSPGIDDNLTVDKGQELGRDDNSSNHPSTPNLWDQAW